MSQTVKFGQIRCNRYSVDKVLTYSYNAKTLKSTRRVGVRQLNNVRSF